MTGIDRDLAQLRHDAIDTERLVAQLTRLDGFILKAHVVLPIARIRPHIGQILRGHVPVLPVRAGHLKPARVGCPIQHDDFAAFLVFAENLVVRAPAGAQVQRAGVRRNLVDKDIIRRGLVLLRDQPHLRGHGGGYGRAEDVSLGEPCPFPVIIDWVDKGELVLAVQGLGHGTGFGADHAQTVVGEIAAVSGINTDHGRSPPVRLL